MLQFGGLGALFGEDKPRGDGSGTALIVTTPKPEKPLGDPNNFHPISLLFVPFKILERLIYTRVEIIIDPLLPQEQAGFRLGRSTADQVTLLK